MNKIGILLGRGIEGCGVTKFTLEQIDYLNKNEYDVSAVAVVDKKWTRTNSHDTADLFTLIKLGKEDVQCIIDRFNDCDVLIINSLPALSHSDDVKDNFKRILDEVTTKVVLIQHDHSMGSIRRNACLDDTIKRADLIMAHATTNPFSNYARELVGPKQTLFETTEGTPIVSFQPAMDFDRCASQYLYKGKRDLNHHKWIGRTTSWKGYKEMFAFHEAQLKPNKQLTTFEGIERSPAYLGFKELAEFEPLVGEEIEDYDLSDAYGKNVHVFGPYVHRDLMKRMQKVGFGYQLSILKPEFIEHSIEYTHCEIACTGTIPVFHKHYGDRCKHVMHGEALSYYDDSGIVWLDPDDLEKTWKDIQEAKKDYKTRAECAFDFLRDHQDSSVAFKKMMDNIKKYV